MKPRGFKVMVASSDGDSSKIYIIKALRVAFNLGLKECKDIADKGALSLLMSGDQFALFFASLYADQLDYKIKGCSSYDTDTFDFRGI